MTPWLRTCLAIGIAWAWGCDDAAVSAVDGDLVVPETLDFGDVPVGLHTSREVTLENVGYATVLVDPIEAQDLSGARHEWTLSTRRISLAPGQRARLGVGFLALGPMEAPAEAQLHFRWALSGGQTGSRTLTLRGRGVPAGLEVVPSPIDFGKVLIGSSRTLDVAVYNRSSSSLDLRTRTGPDGKAELLQVDGTGRFELLAPEVVGGALLPSGASLGPGEAVDLRVRYTPDPARPGRNDAASLVLSSCPTTLCELEVPVSGEGSNAALGCTPSSVDFGRVALGQVATATVSCVNLASDPIEVLGWQASAATDPQLTVSPGSNFPRRLAAQEGVTIEVAYRPTTNDSAARPSGALVVQALNPVLGRPLDDTLVILAGGASAPVIEVLPGRIDFGEIGVGTTARRRVLVSNVGNRQLSVTRVNGDGLGTERFEVDRGSLLVEPGESAVLELSFRPQQMEEALSTLEIVSNDPLTPLITVPLRGLGLVLPPCSYELTATELRFGVVPVLRAAVQGLRIRNIGSTECTLSDLGVDLGSSPAFRKVGGDEPPQILPPGAEKRVEVDYTPQAVGSDRGDLSFYISAAGRSTPTVGLYGEGAAAALLVTPSSIDFGQVGLGCSTVERPITIFNTGSTAVILDKIELATGASAELQLEGLPGGVPSPPGPGVTILPGSSIQVGVRYQAVDYGIDESQVLLFERGRLDPYVVTVSGVGAPDPLNTEAFGQLDSPEVDILFVVDNSGSMAEEQAALAANFDAFIRAADEQSLDYRLAVVTTDVDFCREPATPLPPVNHTQGRCGYFANGSADGQRQNSAWNLISPDEVPSAAEAFAAIVAQGTSGSGAEQGLEAAFRALSSPLITGWNAGFLRRDAYLALVFVSDEEDQSPRSVALYTSYFAGLKGAQSGNLVTASAIVGDSPNGCATAGAGLRYLEVAQATGGIFESICTSDWAQALRNLGLAVFGYKSKFILASLPRLGSLTVEVDGVLLDPTGPSGEVRWTYDGVLNAVVFAPTSIPEPGSQITVHYRPECL